MQRIALLLTIMLVAPVSAQQAERFGDWIGYRVPAEGSEPAIEVVETAQAVRGISVIYSCTQQLEGPEEALLLLNPGFGNMAEGQRFEALFTFGRKEERGYADATLQADPQHATLDVTAGLGGVLEKMQAYATFIVTQQDSPITTIAIPTNGFPAALDEAREGCGM